MELKLLKCDWGMEYLGDPPERLHKYKEAGYDGVECANIGMDPDEFSDLTGELGLDYVAMMFCDDEQAFRDQLEHVKKTRPILVNCHPGRDWFSHERGVDFFRNVMDMAGEVDVQVVYETHRTRCLYSPWATAKYLDGGFLGLKPVLLTTPAGADSFEIARVHDLVVKLSGIDSKTLPFVQLPKVFRWVDICGHLYFGEGGIVNIPPNALHDGFYYVGCPLSASIRR